MRIVFLSVLLLTTYAFAQKGTLIRNNTLDFAMATTTFGIEQHIAKSISVQFNAGYTYAETFAIYDARDLRGIAVDVQGRKYFPRKSDYPLGEFYIGVSVVHRMAYYTTDESYWIDNLYIYNPNTRVNAGYTSVGFIAGYQWEILKGKLFWDNYIGMCGRIGSGYTRKDYGFDFGNLFELSYKGPAPKIGTGFSVAIR
jgi:hypothetical protein